MRRARSMPVAMVVALAFGVCSLIAAGPFGYVCWFEWIELRSWIATPCRIMSSDVPGAPKKPALNAITYLYSFDGRGYQSSRYYFGVPPSADTVRAHPPGEQTTCYVNPADPAEAVLINTIPNEVSYERVVMLVPFEGLCLIAGSLCWMVFSRIKHRRRSIVGDGGPMTLEPRLTALGMAGVYGVVMVILYALALPLMSLGVSSLRPGDWGRTEVLYVTLFVVPFSSLGIFCTYLFGKRVLAVFNARPMLKLTPGRIPLGETAHLSWQFAGRTSSLRSLEILLTGTEQATKPLQRNASVYKHVFYRRVLFQASEPDGMSAGEVTFVVPHNSMHSFESTNNSIEWSIEVCTEAVSLPDLAILFPITVTRHEQAVA
jgi:hypothetical protein